MTERFSTEVTEVLTTAGWAAGRQVGEQTTESVRYVCDQVGRRGARIEPFYAALAALDEFGGLYVIQDGPGAELRRRPFAIDPVQVAASTETLADFGGVLDTRLFPLGMEGDHDATLTIDGGEPPRSRNVRSTRSPLFTGTGVPAIFSLTEPSVDRAVK